MNQTDTSDEAYWKCKIALTTTYEAWQECRRRCEALLEERERKAFEAGIEAFQFGITDERLKVSREWEDEAYRAFKEAQK